MISKVTTMFSWVAISSTTLLGVLGVSIWGYSFLVLIFIVMVLLSMLDTLLWFYIARSRQIVTSKKFLDGVVMKMWRTVIVAFLVIVFWHVASITDNETIQVTTSIISISSLLAVSRWEVTSIVENLIILTPDWENKTVLSWMSRILWIAKSIAEKRLRWEEQKINK
jgi:glucan phosphoethanolaminetransferase (alkaline phosphatase superfamily)